jgi:two-component system, cell cycle sensor histidine kinase and response regulator CckA
MAQSPVEHVTRELRRAQAELDRLRRREALLSGILDDMPEAYMRADLDGRVIAANPAAARDWGYASPDEMIGLPAEALFADPSERQTMLQQLREQGRVADFVTRTRRKDGSTFWVRLSVRTVRDERGIVVGTDGFVRDVTERKQAEQALARSHDLLLNLARLVPGVIYQYRLYPDGRSAFPYSSPGMNDIYEVAPEDVQEDATPVFARLHPDDYDSVAGAIQESARTLETFYCEFRVVLPRQGLRWRWSQAQPQRTADGGTLWHGIILDVTDRKLAETEKAALEEQLRQAQKMESVGRLAGGVAHDFNNMLGVILGHAEIALDRVQPSEPIREDLEQILGAARRSADLTRQLLAFARRQTVAPQVLDLSETVKGLIAMLRRLMGENIRLNLVQVSGLWKVRVDPSQIDQLLANLCVNARDAISGVGRVTIEMGNTVIDDGFCERHPGFVAGEFVRIAVTDDGCGMEADTLPHLFEPFFTTKALGSGTGLGLATVYGIVKQNHGFIDVESAPESGTTMTVYFPRYRGDAAVAAESRHRPSALRGSETILLVEDEPAMLSMATIVLRGLGYTVLPARTPDEAIELAGTHAERIDLLVTDVVMPDMNGRELAQRILSRHPHIRHLFMSGYTADVIARQGVLDDGVPFLQKPFSREVLAVKLRQALDRQPGDFPA